MTSRPLVVSPFRSDSNVSICSHLLLLMSRISRTWTKVSVGMEVETTRTLVRVGGREVVFSERMEGVVMSAERRRWRAVAERTARGLV